MKFVLIFIILILYEKGNGTSNLPNSQRFRQIRRIIGGKIANIQNFPSVACLILKNSDEDDFRGGAVIIGEYWALTAAHCMNYISSADIKERIAFIRSNSANWKQKFSEHVIVTSYVHDQYDEVSTDYDIALLKVKEPFNGLNEKPAKLIESNYEYVTDSIATVVGWGTTDPEAIELFTVDILRFANIKITNFTICRDVYKEEDENITERMICGISPGKDACIYDSGGPLYQNNVLIGLVSWGGTKCADLAFPGIYTKLSLFPNWINEHIRLGSSSTGEKINKTKSTYNIK